MELINVNNVSGQCYGYIIDRKSEIHIPAGQNKKSLVFERHSSSFGKWKTNF